MSTKLKVLLQKDVAINSNNEIEEVVFQHLSTTLDFRKNPEILKMINICRERKFGALPPVMERNVKSFDGKEVFEFIIDDSTFDERGHYKHFQSAQWNPKNLQTLTKKWKRLTEEEKDIHQAISTSLGDQLDKLIKECPVEFNAILQNVATKT